MWARFLPENQLKAVSLLVAHDEHAVARRSAVGASANTGRCILHGDVGEAPFTDPSLCVDNALICVRARQKPLMYLTVSDDSLRDNEALGDIESEVCVIARAFVCGVASRRVAKCLKV